MPQSVERKCLAWLLKLSSKKFASSINYNEFNVGKQSQKYSMKMKINKVKILKFK